MEVGNFAEGKVSAAEARSIAAATGRQLPWHSQAMLAAWCDEPESALETIRTLHEQRVAEGSPGSVAYHERCAALVHLGSGQYRAALELFESAKRHSPTHGDGLQLSDFVEAAVRSGELELAATAGSRFLAHTRSVGGDAARGYGARAEALLSGGETAEALYRESVECFRRTILRSELARTHLLYGEWLRRENRRMDAREQLRQAYELFSAMGAKAFTERARRELLATGEKVRKRVDETRGDLTPQETQIARLAADGYTNPEIGAQLFLSPRTVEYHLRKAYPKLGISSRRQLRTLVSI
jgi:DNA-binding CsgD family transcriptional regulator